ncbi:MAG: hypothetical protein OXU20_22230, partial [Myxococcales bacterium]|nr:hypothetical protein [Myxococcales bacterium]
MTSIRTRAALTLLVLTSALWPTRSAAEQPDPRCSALFELAAQFLGKYQYAQMLAVANDRQQLCPGALSLYMVGLAQANLVDKRIVSGPRREMMRLQAIRTLDAASAANPGQLRPEWVLTIHEWIEKLRTLRPSSSPPHAGATAALSRDDSGLQE